MPTIVRQVRTYSPNGKIGGILAKAGSLQGQIKRLEKQLDVLRPKLLEHMKKVKKDNIFAPGVEVQRKSRDNWTYSAACEAVMLRIRRLQKLEQERGIAKNNAKEYVAILVTKG